MRRLCKYVTHATIAIPGESGTGVGRAMNSAHAGGGFRIIDTGVNSMYA